MSNSDCVYNTDKSIILSSEVEEQKDREFLNTDVISIGEVFRKRPLKLDEKELEVDLISLEIGEFDVILGMDWLVAYHAHVDCFKKEVNFVLPSGEEFRFSRIETESADGLDFCNESSYDVKERV